MTAGLRGSSSGMPASTLPDEVGADVGGLGVDAAAELREERDERRAEAVPDDQEGDLGRRDLGEPGHQPVEAADSEERHGHDEEARDGAAPESRPERVVQGRPRGRGGPDVRADRDPHADVARDDRADRAEGKGEGRPEGQPQGRGDRVEVVVGADEAVEQEDDRGEKQRQDADRRVLPPEERLGAFLDGVGDGLHGRGAGVAAEDPPHEVAGDEQRPDGENEDQGQGKLVRHSSNSCFVVVLRVAPDGADRRGRISEGRLREGPPGSGSAGPGSTVRRARPPSRCRCSWRRRCGSDP